MMLPRGEGEVSPKDETRSTPAAQDRAWLWVLGLALAIPMALFYASGRRRTPP